MHVDYELTTAGIYNELYEIGEGDILVTPQTPYIIRYFHDFF